LDLICRHAGGKFGETRRNAPAAMRAANSVGPGETHPPPYGRQTRWDPEKPSMPQQTTLKPKSPVAGHRETGKDDFYDF
jgi:hypothetical protein